MSAQAVRASTAQSAQTQAATPSALLLAWSDACRVSTAPGTALAALGPTAVLSVHLDATSEEKRVRQLSNCLERARQLGTREVIIAGDLNTEMWSGSCVEAFVAG